MAPAIRTALKAVLSLGLTGLFLWSAFRHVDTGELGRAVAQADLLPIAAAVCALFLTTFPRALRWRLLIAPADPDIKLRPLFNAVLIAYAGNNLFPRAGEFARVLAARRSSSAGMGALLATVIVERIIDLLTLILIAAAVLYAIRDELAVAFPWLEGVATSSFIATTLLLAGFIALAAYGHRGLDSVGRLVARVSPTAGIRIVEVLGSFLDGIAAIRSPSRYAGIIFWTALLNLGYFLTLYLPLHAFHLDETYGLGVEEALTVLAISTIGVILPTPGGAGTYHFFCSQTLYRLYGVRLEDALAFATVVHAISYFLFLIAGGPGLVRLLWRRRTEKAET